MPSPEFTILDSGLAFGTGTLHHAWFRLADRRGRESVRAVALKELAYLPIETRDDPDVLGKQWAALRGQYIELVKQTGVGESSSRRPTRSWPGWTMGAATTKPAHRPQRGQVRLQLRPG